MCQILSSFILESAVMYDYSSVLSSNWTRYPAAESRNISARTICKLSYQRLNRNFHVCLTAHSPVIQRCVPIGLLFGMKVIFTDRDVSRATTMSAEDAKHL